MTKAALMLLALTACVTVPISALPAPSVMERSVSGYSWTENGCLIDSWNRALSAYQFANETSMTQEMCQNACLARNYVYAGLEIGTQCFCANGITYGDSSSGAGAPASECNTPCVGNKTQNGGGGFRVWTFKYVKDVTSTQSPAKTSVKQTTIVPSSTPATSTAKVASSTSIAKSTGASSSTSSAAINKSSAKVTSSSSQKGTSTSLITVSSKAASTISVTSSKASTTGAMSSSASKASSVSSKAPTASSQAAVPSSKAGISSSKAATTSSTSAVASNKAGSTTSQPPSTSARAISSSAKSQTSSLNSSSSTAKTTPKASASSTSTTSSSYRTSTSPGASLSISTSRAGSSTTASTSKSASKSASTSTSSSAAATKSAIPGKVNVGVKKAGLGWTSDSGTKWSDFTQAAGSVVGWTYDWNSVVVPGTPLGALEFVPMAWGGGSVDGFARDSANFAALGVTSLLSFNEPDQQWQNGGANMSPAEGAQYHQLVFNSTLASNYRIGTPAVARGSKWWLEQWLTACGGKCAYDFVPLHFYGTNAADMITYIKDFISTFGKPVWVTEYACMDFGGVTTICTEEQATTFQKEVMNYMYHEPMVERYAAFGTFTSWASGGNPNGMMNSDGSANALGILYASYI